MNAKLKSPDLPPHVHIARYDKNQCIPRFRGNPLVEALPPSLSEEELYAALVYYPEFNETDREWPTHLRIQQMLELQNFMHPGAAAIELGMTLDGWLRSGYVGRIPGTRSKVAITQDVYAASKEPGAYRQTADTIRTRLSSALLGSPGMGKSTLIARFLARYPQVIYHPDTGTFQITYLYYEVPADGRSVKSLCIDVISQIDRLIPGATYVKDYTKNGRATADTLIPDLAHLVDKHCVGLLIPDEVQNITNAKKGDETLVSELTALSNRAKTPQLWVGTSKAEHVLKRCLAQGRRSLNSGLGNWDPHRRHERRIVDDKVEKYPGEYADFMEVLWRYQWIRKPSKLNDRFLDIFYECTQGVNDLIIKLFVLSQIRAMHNNEEQLTEQLIRSVYKDYFGTVHEMIEAMASGDARAMLKFQDVKTRDVDLRDAVNDLNRRFLGPRQPSASLRTNEAAFLAKLVKHIVTLDIEQDEAEELASKIVAEKDLRDYAHACEKARAYLKPQSGSSARTGKAKEASDKDAANEPDYSSNPKDLRNALVAAKRDGTPVYEKLKELKMLPDMQVYLC